MPSRLKQTSRPTTRRLAIKFAALDCFLAKGFAATTIADVRKRSGATTGSIYHFYAGKPALAFELFSDAVENWRLVTEEVTASNRPEDRIRGAALGLIDWGVSEPTQFRFVEEVRALHPNHPELADCANLLSARQPTTAQIYADLMREDRVQPMSWPLAHALILGPATDYVRAAIALPEPPIDHETTRSRLATAAWHSVRT